MSVIIGRNSTVTYNWRVIDMLSGETKFNFVVLKNRQRVYVVSFYINYDDQERLQELSKKIVLEIKQDE